MNVKTLFKILAAAAILTLTFACGEANTTSSVVTPTEGSVTTNSGSSISSSPTYKIGQTVKVGDTWEIVVNGVKTNAGSDIDQPKAGNHYLLVDVTLHNLSGQAQTASSLAQWDVQDNTGQTYTATIVSFAPNAPDGTVAAGGKLRGTLAYEVPTKEHHFLLAFQSDVFSAGSTTWTLDI